jgi:ankyrin repeat protein
LLTDHPPIHLACLAGNTEEITALLQQDHHLVHAKGAYENTPLHCAATEAVARLLIAWKADVNAPGWMGQTPLHVAAQEGRTDIVRLLIQYGADVNARRAHDIMPLHWAANAEIAQLLIEHGAMVGTPDHFGDTPLHHAARSAHDDVISLLLSLNADIHARNMWGQTPLFEAVGVGSRRRRNTLLLLLQAGADVNAQDSTWGFTPLLGAIRRAGIEKWENDDSIQLLLDHGADIYHRDFSGRTPFHLAKYDPQRLALLTEHTRKVGPAPIITPEQFVIQRTWLHPHKQEVITEVKYAILARWRLDNSPRLLVSTATVHSRFNNLAISPDGETIVLAPAEEPVELRRWSDFSLLPSDGVPISNEATALAFSPNGRWFALADRQEAIYVIDRATGKVTAQVEGGEWTPEIFFDPTSTLLASRCVIQDSQYVRLDKLSDDGQLIALHDIRLPIERRGDEMSGLGFSPDGKWLALFASSSSSQFLQPSGWRGDIVLYNVETGTVRWQVSIDAQVTGDKRSLKEAGYPGGFFTRLLFVSNTEIACRATEGTIIFYDVVTGKPTRRIALPTNVAIRDLFLDKDGQRLWGVVDDEKFEMFPICTL